MVIIYTSSRRAVLRRFAALLIAPQRFVMYYAMCRYATPHRSLHRSAAQLNDLLCTTQRTPLLTAPLGIASTRSASRRSAPLLPAELLKATRRFVCYAAPLRASSRLGSSQCNASQLNAAPRNSTQRFVCYVASQRIAPYRKVAQLITTLLNDLFVTRQLNAAQCNSSGLDAPRLIATRRFVCYNATNGTALLASTPRITPLLNAPIRNSTRRFVCYNAAWHKSAQRYASHRPAYQRISTN